MKMTWQEYGEQPSWFIDEILGLLKAEADATQREISRAKTKQ